MTTSKYPLDFDLLNKGDVITTEIIEEAMGCKSTARDFNFKMLALKALIEKATGYNVKAQNYTELRILDDEEGVSYNQQTWEHGLNKLRRAAAIARNVDVEQLSNVSRNLLERQMLNQSRQMQALRRTRREIASEEKSKQLT